MNAINVKMPTGELSPEYIRWLFEKVWDKELHYPAVLEALLETKFIWSVPNDDNREQDGAALRDEYFAITFGRRRMHDRVTVESISLLEVLIALSRRLEYFTNESSKWWFWKMNENIGLFQCENHGEMFAKLSDLVLRRYDSKGNGSLFPLRNEPRMPMFQTELWYQMMQYLRENP